MKGINIIVDIGILPIPFMTRQQLEEINKQSKSDQPNIDVNKSCPKESDNLSEVEGIMPAKKPQKNHRDKK